MNPRVASDTPFMPPELAAVTPLLRAWQDGDIAARDRLMGAVYHRLRRIAGNLVGSEPTGYQATELVHEAHLALAASRAGNASNRREFYEHVASEMRRILVRRASQETQRGGGRVRAARTADEPAASDPYTSLVSLDEALTRMEQLHPRRASVVNLRFFGGFSNEEVASVLGVSGRTVERDWLAAKLWLFDQIEESP